MRHTLVIQHNVLHLTGFEDLATNLDIMLVMGYELHSCVKASEGLLHYIFQREFSTEERINVELALKQKANKI